MPLLVAEPATPAMQAEFGRDSVMLVWWVTEVECVSALARLEREKALSSAAMEQALERLEALRSSWNEVQPVAQVRRLARRLLRVHELRSADALQLAAALVASEGETDSLEIVSLDEGLVEAARREGLAIARVGDSRSP